MAEKKLTTVHLHRSNALQLRVDEIDRGRDGIEVAKYLGDINLVPGKNESVDADLWDFWYKQNKGGPLVTSGFVTEEKPQENPDGEKDTDGSAANAASADRGTERASGEGNEQG